ncbi:hypothetical protein KM031_14335 [Gemmobacter fulvus]|uniref:Uncharacterized protein n=1 Tax=Gemmobacter fulvus TaxID=2840474 RepID=A0A975P519_9RHOB|nr:hypothetical protein [Gemmobacter fulvus]MBT9247494.1 hypothetical protein [Gemmobacter fulvus]QWK89995.1 hypothetical protein KM031_14335 [Gemmobacter fulvus]
MKELNGRRGPTGSIRWRGPQEELAATPHDRSEPILSDAAQCANSGFPLAIVPIAMEKIHQSDFVEGQSMKSIFALIIPVCALFSMTGVPAVAAPSGNQICKKMISEARGGGLSQSDCLCTYRVADAVLDEDVKSLLFDSWYNGTNNMQAIERLPQQNRVRKQLRTMQRSLKANCE